MEPITLLLAIGGIVAGFGASTAITNKKLGAAKSQADKELKNAKKEAEKSLEDAKKEANKLAEDARKDEATRRKELKDVEQRLIRP